MKLKNLKTKIGHFHFMECSALKININWWREVFKWLKD